MPTGFDEAFQKVKQLVADFRANERFFLSTEYQEQEARRDFIDKFWMALGWDVNHDTQKNPYEQEVKVERREHGISQRRADYAFYLRPNFRDVKFYVEAKKPHGDIATADNYFQINRYGWNSQTPIGVLHDFEQFEIIDCRYKPNVETSLGQNIRKYHFSHYEDSEKFAEIYWLFSHEAVANGSIEKFAETLPKKRGKAVQRGLLAGGYLLENRSVLEGRERGKWKHDQWYALGRSQNLSEMEQEKLLTPSIASRASFTYDAEDYFYFVGSGGGGGGGYGITLRKETGLAYPFVLGLLNSKLLDFYLKSVSSPFQHGYYAYNRQYIERLPIASADKSRHDKMVSLVEQMLAAKKQLAAAQSDKDKDFYTHRCDGLDRQIDLLVYELYGLTPEEIKIVEGAK